MAEEKTKEAKAKEQTEQTDQAKPTQTTAAKAEEPAKAPAGQKSKKFSSEIKKLGDKIVSLTLMQAKELTEYLKVEYEIEPAAAGAVMVAGPAASSAEAAAEQAEQTTFDVILKGFGDKKIQVIKEVRALTGLGLKEAKDLVEGVPKPVKQQISKQEAEDAKKKLEDAGAVVELS